MSPQTVASLWEVFRATLQRLHATQPQSERWLFGLGDAAYEVGQFRDAVRYDWTSLTLVLPCVCVCVLTPIRGRQVLPAGRGRQQFLLLRSNGAHFGWLPAHHSASGHLSHLNTRFVVIIIVRPLCSHGYLTARVCVQLTWRPLCYASSTPRPTMPQLSKVPLHTHTQTRALPPNGARQT